MWRALLLNIGIFVLQTNARFNLYITQEEFKKLVGMEAQLYYVQEGVVNDYALNFVVMVPANISDLQFTWQSLTKHPIPYVISINYESQGAMFPPQMNISSIGVIPTSVQTFRIRLLCTGLKSAEIEVQLQLNVSAHNKLQNETSLNFRRNKICLKGKGASYRNDSILLDPESLANSTSSMYVAMACSVAMITAVVVTTSAVCIKNKKMRSQETSYITAAYDSNQHVFVRLGSAMRRTPSGSGSYATIASIHKSPPSPSPYATSDAVRVSYYASSQVMLLSQMNLQDVRLCDPTDRLRALSLPRSSIALEELTQDGTFGQIYRGNLRNKESVFIKTVTESASNLQISLFLAEGTMMFGMMHKNILPIIGVNVENPRKPMLVYPYVNKGNLKRFLIKCRQREDGQLKISTLNLVDMAIQITLGIIYLHSQCVCYKDLATRNCLIDDQLQIKITDNSLSRDLFPNDYTCLGDNENRPVKWLAIESLLHKQFTAASDVWSFGVVLWELTTLAQQPYVEIDPFEMLNHLEKGYRLFQPIGCPDELFTVMTCCWLANPIERPTFAQLLAYLQDFYIALGKYI